MIISKKEFNLNFNGSAFGITTAEKKAVLNIASDDRQINFVSQNVDFRSNNENINLLMKDVPQKVFNFSNVILREVLNSENFYTKSEADALLLNKLDVPTTQDWTDFSNIIRI